MGYFLNVGASLLMGIILIPMFAFTIYIYVLFIKLARRGITALDLYIDEKKSRRL